MNEYLEMISIASPLLIISAAFAFAEYGITFKKVTCAVMEEEEGAMVELNETEVATLEKFQNRVSKTYPRAQYSVVRRGEGHLLELDVLIVQLSIASAQAVQAAANDVHVTDGVYIVPHVSPTRA